MTKQQERKQARTVMKLLTPIVTRCRTFVFEVQHGSSLPAISQDFRGNAKHLHVLKLECEFYDGDKTLFYGAAPEIPEGEEFKCPCLTTLALDGNTFRDAYFASWTKQFKSTYLNSLSIYGLSPPDAENVGDDFDLDALCQGLRDIGFIHHLTLHDHNHFYVEGASYSGGDSDLTWDNLTLIGHGMEDFLVVTYPVLLLPPIWLRSRL